VLLTSIIVSFGSLLVAYFSHNYRFRLSGVVTIPFFIIYCVYEWSATPVLIISISIVLLTLEILNRYTLVYGRDTFIISIIAGSIIPLLTLIMFNIPIDIAFIGSIIPGISAYNIHQVGHKYQLSDLGISIAITIALATASVIVIFILKNTIIPTATDPILVSSQSDTGRYFGSPHSTELIERPRRSATLIYLVISFVISETARRMYGYRLGLITIGLVTLFYTESQILGILFIITTIVAYVMTYLIHRYTLLYGRVLLGLCVGVSVLFVGLLSVFVNLNPAIPALICSVLASVFAYNIHITHPNERITTIMVAFAMFFTLLPLNNFITIPILTQHIIPVSGTITYIYIVVAIVLFTTAHCMSDYNSFRKLKDNKWVKKYE
jgi:hypothetical protein